MSSPPTRNRRAQASTSETALVVFVREAETLVRPFRERHDPSAAAGCPAHVTLLYPFKPAHEIGAAVVDDLRRCFASCAPFRFSLVDTRRFPGVLYLAPEPDEPFRRLTLAVWERYPEAPPYAGKHLDIVPHLCVAQTADEQQLERVADDFVRTSSGRLPIRAAATDVAMIDNTSGRWRVRETFRLGTG